MARVRFPFPPASKKVSGQRTLTSSLATADFSEEDPQCQVKPLLDYSRLVGDAEMDLIHSGPFRFPFGNSHKGKTPVLALTTDRAKVSPVS